MIFTPVWQSCSRAGRALARPDPSGSAPRARTIVPWRCGVIGRALCTGGAFPIIRLAINRDELRRGPHHSAEASTTGMLAQFLLSARR